MSLLRLASRVYNTPHLMERSKLSVVLNVLGPRLGDLELSAAKALPEDLPAAPIGYYAGAAVISDTDDEERRSRRPYTVTPSGIAIIDIFGIMVQRATGLDALSGLTSYEQIGSEVQQAIDDPDVRGIMLNLDTPGGETSGAFDLADFLWACSKKKKIWSIANDAAFSGGYLLASQTSRIYTTQTGGVGSIGVIAVHVDQSGYDKQEGLRYTAVFAGSHKNDLTPHEPPSKSALAELQRHVDTLYRAFVGVVSRGQGISESAVAATEARLYFGQDAIKSGLAQRVGPLGEALEDFATALDSSEKADVTSSGSGYRSVAQSPQVAKEVMMAKDENKVETVAEAGASIAASTATETPATSEPAEVENAVEEEGVEAKEEVEEEVEEEDVEEEGEEEASEDVEALKDTAATTATPDTASLIAAARAEGQKSALTGVEAIIELCTIAGDPGLALSYIQSHATVDKVRKDLLRLRAEASDALGIRSTVLPVRATVGAGANDNPVVKAAENLAAAITARTSGRQ